MGRIKDKSVVDPKEVYNYLTTVKKISPAHALGVMANIQAESNFNSNAIGDSGTSGGLFQHHGSRFASLKQYAGNDWTDWKKQVDFALQEGKSKQYLAKNFATPEEASMWWTTEWERPADKFEKAKVRVNNINNFAHFTNYTATPYQEGSKSKYTPGIIPPEVLNKSHQFEVIDAATGNPITMTKEILEGEIEKVKNIENKVEESPARKEIELRKKEHKNFLKLLNQPDNIVTYKKSDKISPVEAAPVIAPSIQTSLPDLQNLFSTKAV